MANPSGIGILNHSLEDRLKWHEKKLKLAEAQTEYHKNQIQNIKKFMEAT